MKKEELKQQNWKAPNFKVGDGVTYHLWSDSHACTIIKRTAKTLTLQQDKAIKDPNFKPQFIIGGFSYYCLNSDEQRYSYERDPKAPIIVAHWSNKYNAFMYCNKRITEGRHEYYDYNF